MPIDNLADASQQNNVPGALQQMLLSRVHSPLQSSDIDARRQAALEQYQNSLRQPAEGSMTPTMQGLYSWVGNMGKTTPQAAWTSGVAAGGSALTNNQANLVKGDIAASKVGYEDATSLDKLDQSELANLRMSANSANKMASAESLRPLYKEALSQARQLAKNAQFADPAAELEWIKTTTNSIVQDYVTRYGVNISPVTMAQLSGEEHALPSGGLRPGPVTTKVAPTAGQPTPVQQVLSQDGTKQTPTDGQALGTQQNVVGDFAGDPTKIMKEVLAIADPAERQAALQALVTQMGPGAQNSDKLMAQSNPKFDQTLPTGRPAFKNIPNQEMMKAGAKEMGGAYGKDYLVLQEAAAGAKDQYDALRNLENIDPNTNAFANVTGYIGTALQGLGADPNTPLIQDAIKNRQANIIVSQMKNAALTQQKGVQTRSDEIRIADELAKTTDPVQVWKYAIAIGKERTQRRMEQLEYADAVAAANNGVPVSARAKYMQEYANDPITQKIEGRMVFRTPTIAAYMRKYPDASKQEAVNYWRSLEKRTK